MVNQRGKLFLSNRPKRNYPTQQAETLGFHQQPTASLINVEAHDEKPKRFDTIAEAENLSFNHYDNIII